ncbi:MAG: class I SAM-dependent methyltransferase [Oscillochloridaceae bacterium umkhey_bin13]
MVCCHHCQDAENIFDQRDARRRLARYQRHGPEGTTRVLIEALREAGVSGATMLDIGGGVGVVHHELLRLGAASATDVDASSAYLAVAQQESVRRGHAERVRYLHGDFVTLAPRIEPSDIVVLDRVVCCYPAMPALVGAAASRTKRLLGLVYPRDAWWVCLGIRAANLGLALQRSAFRIYCHSSTAVEAELRKAGFTRSMHRTRGLWQIEIYAAGQARETQP